MPLTMPAESPRAPRNRFDHLRPQMAKALNPVEDAQARERRRIGRALRRAMRILDLSDKEACDMLGEKSSAGEVVKPLDKGQLSRWLSGEENVVLARIYGTRLHGPFAIEQASDASGVVVETAVTIRRTA